MENAQRFLAMTLPGKAYYAAGMKQALEAVRRKTGGSAEVEGNATITEASAVARCKTRLLYRYPESAEIIYRAQGHTQRNKLLTAFPHLRGDQGNPDGLPWNDVLEVNATGSRVFITLGGASARLEMDLGANSLADRVAYAMEFLRAICDNASETGF